MLKENLNPRMKFVIECWDIYHNPLNGAFGGGLHINCVMAAKINVKYSVQYYA